jgi:hypothetical protein
VDAQLAAYLHGAVAGALGRPVTLKGRIASGRMDIETGTISGTDVSLSVRAVRDEEGMGYFGPGGSRRVSTISYTVLLADLVQNGVQYRPEKGWVLTDGEAVRHVTEVRSVSNGTMLVIGTSGAKSG